MDHEDNVIVNRSGNTPFSEILKGTTKSRRSVLRGGTAVGLASLFGSGITRSVLAQEEELIGFTPVSRSRAAGSWIAVAPEYELDLVFPWGEPIDPSGPTWSYPLTPDNQEAQVGVGHDGMWFFPIEGEDRGVICINHEFGSNGYVIGKSDPEDLNDVRISQHAHGVSVLDIAKIDGSWQITGGCNTRRIHVNTPVTFGGPLKNSLFVQTPNGGQPMGTLNNCGCGKTPWGTYLTCEENFNGYFGATNLPNRWIPSEAQQRYGFSENGFGYGWHLFDKRFDVCDPGTDCEEHRFGWVVEIDPFNANAKPVKRSALGRFKHESAEVVIGKDNRIVVYMGDDQIWDYIYKFVGDEDYEAVLARGESPLDHGKLYCARFDFNYSGEWLELTEENRLLFLEIGAQDRILTYARLAADLLDATPMDRPEWITTAPDGRILFALTNNSQRSSGNRANPQAPNPDGHILRIRETDNDYTGTTFRYNVYMTASSKHNTEESFSDPDCIYADPDGRLFILTDGTQQDLMNNQMLVANIETGEVKRLFSGVPGCEITGITPTADRTEMFINVQHPGNGALAVTDFPRLEENPVVPRDATVVLRRTDGGVVGS